MLKNLGELKFGENEEQSISWFFYVSLAEDKFQSLYLKMGSNDDDDDDDNDKMKSMMIRNMMM